MVVWLFLYKNNAKNAYYITNMIVFYVFYYKKSVVISEFVVYLTSINPFVNIVISKDMKLSTRNQLKGTISSITEGAINAEVILTLPGGTKIVSVVTNGAVKNLDLKVGDAVFALIKSSSVIIGIDVQKISARNVLTGKISSILEGSVNDEVSINLGSGYTVTAVITKSSVASLELEVGKEASAIVKASSVILAVD